MAVFEPIYQWVSIHYDLIRGLHTDREWHRPLTGRVTALEFVGHAPITTLLPGTPRRVSRYPLPRLRSVTDGIAVARCAERDWRR